MAHSSVEIGDLVVDRETPGAIPVIVVSLPEMTAADWITYGGTTLAQANPAYSANAPVVVVVDAADVDTYLAAWDHETPLPRTALDEAGVYYRGMPASRLAPAGDTPTET